LEEILQNMEKGVMAGKGSEKNDAKLDAVRKKLEI
jgi:hypothetical protein